MLSQSFIPELQHEAASTRKMLERLPFDKSDWKPHARSMALLPLATHVTELAGWVSVTINTPQLDFANFEYKPFAAQSTEDLLRYHDETVAKAIEDLKGASDETMMQPWTLRNGEHVILTMPRIAVIRSFAISHLIHHRGQLSVYLRMLDVPVPGMYGPSADEMPGA